MTDKLDELSKKIAAAKGSEETKKEPSNSGMALKIVSELIASTLVGIGIGYGIDSFFDTQPWFLLVFLMLGMGTGFYNIYRMSMKTQ